MIRFYFPLLLLLVCWVTPVTATPDTTQQRINYYIAKAEFDSAKTYILNTLAAAATTQEKSTLNYQLVKVLFIQSNYREALERAFTSLDDVNDRKEKVNFNFLIGCIYSAIKDYEKSIEYFDFVLQDTEDSSMLVKTHLLSSELYLELKDSSGARQSLAEAYEITRNAKLDRSLENHVAMQHNFFSQHYEACKQLNFRVLEDSTSFSSSRSYAFSMIGDCLVEQDSLLEAVKYYEDFLAITFQTKDPEQVKVAAKKLITVYEKIGPQEKANTYHKIYNEAIRDAQSFSVEKYRKLYDLEKQRELSSAKASKNKLIVFLLLLPLLLFGGYLYRQRKVAPLASVSSPKKVSGKKIVISDVEIEKIKAALGRLVKEQLFLIPKITRKSFCVTHKIKSERYLSHYINTEHKKSFSVFVNDLRVAYAYDRLQTDSHFRNYRIEEIAKASGFGSKKSFERVFTAKYEETPYKVIVKLTS